MIFVATDLQIVNAMLALAGVTRPNLTNQLKLGRRIASHRYGIRAWLPEGTTTFSVRETRDRVLWGVL